jgi:histidyl-tRNA synthetase
MAVQKPSIPKGTRDFGPAEVQKRKYILNTIETVFKKYGFMPIETPTMENLSTLEGKYGDEGDKLLFKILDSGDFLKNTPLKDRTGKIKEAFNKRVHSGRQEDEIENILNDAIGDIFDNLTWADIELLPNVFVKEIAEKGLRYDLTVPFARYVVMNRNEITFPFKRYQMQPVWRADRPQKGRYREFWQCDADVVGSDSLLNELDLIQIYDEAFRKLGIGNYELRINNRKILAGIAEVVKSKDFLSTVSVAIDKLDKIGEEGVRKELGEQGFNEDELNRLFEIITIKGENQYLLSSLKEKLTASEEGLKGIEELQFVLDTLSVMQSGAEAQHSINLKIDFSLARGLSYYTGCILEVVSTEGTLTSSIAGGGRYDNLTGVFGLPNVSGVGISFGLDRIYDVMEELKLFPTNLNATSTKVLICTFDDKSQQYALAPLKQLRDAGIASEIYPDLKKLGKQLDYANALKIPYAIIIGDNEMNSGKLVLKNLNEGTQEELTIAEIINKLN